MTGANLSSDGSILTNFPGDKLVVPAGAAFESHSHRISGIRLDIETGEIRGLPENRKPLFLAVLVNGSVLLVHGPADPAARFEEPNREGFGVSIGSHSEPLTPCYIKRVGLILDGGSYHVEVVELGELFLPHQGNQRSVEVDGVAVRDWKRLK